MRNRLIFITILAAAGIVLSALSLQLHYSVKPSTFCNFNSTFNCDVVNKSWASQIAGIPVALIGIIGYALILLGSSWLLFTKKLFHFTWGAISIASLGGLGFSLFLTGVEVFDLHSFCIYCLGSQAVMLAISILVWAAPDARQGFRSWFFSSSSS
jgi:vitamin-K-epoxide reductase (warfarin-sensitive)